MNRPGWMRSRYERMASQREAIHLGWCSILGFKALIALFVFLELLAPTPRWIDPLLGQTSKRRAYHPLPKGEGGVRGKGALWIQRV